MEQPAQNDNTDGTEEEENIDDRAQFELEEVDDGLYFMIQYSSIARGMNIEPEGISHDDELILARNAGELNARYMVDKSFAKQLMEDSKFKVALKLMKKEDGKLYNRQDGRHYILTLHTIFENRYGYMCALHCWNKRRWKYLKLSTEREGVAEFFETERTRFVDSIPPLPAFDLWKGLMDELTAMFEEEIQKQTLESMTY